MPAPLSMLAPRELLFLQNGITAGIAIAAGIVGACHRTSPRVLSATLDAIANDDRFARAISENLLSALKPGESEASNHRAIVEAVIDMLPAEMKRGLMVVPPPKPDPKDPPNG